MRKIGYARVSEEDQTTALQRDALEQARCAVIFEESASGGKRDRPVLRDLLDTLQEGDVLVVWKLDRLSRSLRDLLGFLEEIESKGARFQSLTEAIDTTTSAGRMVAHLIGVFAEFERSIIRERTRAGMKAAQKKGVHTGRPPRLSDAEIREIRAKVEREEWTIQHAAQRFGVHRSTIARAMDAEQKGAGR